MKKQLDIQKVFVFRNDRVNITLMIPITENEKEVCIEVIKKDTVAELACGMPITEKRIVLLGDPSTITGSDASKLNVMTLGYFILIDYETREYKVNDNGYASVCEYHDPCEMIKLASAMLGNPKEALVLKMTYDAYLKSDFYINTIKPLTHKPE